jgi:hypothetical protein
MKNWPRWRNLKWAIASQSHRTCVADSSSSRHLSQVGSCVNPSFKRCPFKWHCPVNCPTVLLNWSLFNFNRSFVLLAGGPDISPFACLSPVIDSRCFMWLTRKYVRDFRLMKDTNETCENILELYLETKKVIYNSETRSTWDYREPSPFSDNMIGKLPTMTRHCTKIYCHYLIYWSLEAGKLSLSWSKRSRNLRYSANS